MSYVIYIPAEPAAQLLQYAAETEQTVEDVVAQAFKHYMQKGE